MAPYKRKAKAKRGHTQVAPYKKRAMKDRIIIGTRRSRLARIQTEIVERALREAFPGLEIVRREIVTRGDRDSRDCPAVGDCPVMPFETPGIFTREIETRLLAGDIDLAVHSFKDLPTQLPDGLRVAATPTRADPRDALVVASSFVGGDPCVPPSSLSSSGKERSNTGPHMGGPLQELRRGAVVGTSSPRRSAQLLAIRPDLVIRDLRGNVDTRLAKLARGDYDAIVVAKAALDRLSFSSSLVGGDACVPPLSAKRMNEEGPHVGGPLQEEALDPDVMLPAPAQGALAVECREGDVEVERLAGAIHDAATFVATSAERELLARLGGGCRLALGALAEVSPDGALRLRAAVLSRDGRRAVRAEARGRAESFAAVVEECRTRLLESGAGDLLK